jgi:hypothetical protein
MTIPMPGHIVKGAEAVAECKATVAKLEQLIAEHDVVFLLLDSREARWLPTVIATAQSKVRAFSLFLALFIDMTEFLTSSFAVGHDYGSGI